MYIKKTILEVINFFFTVLLMVLPQKLRTSLGYVTFISLQSLFLVTYKYYKFGLIGVIINSPQEHQISIIMILLQIMKGNHEHEYGTSFS